MDKGKDSIKEDETMNSASARPLTPKELLSQSLKEMQLMREGKIPKISWHDYQTKQNQSKSKTS